MPQVIFEDPKNKIQPFWKNEGQPLDVPKKI